MQSSILSGQVVKTKDPIQDLYKAKDYIEREIAFHKEKTGTNWVSNKTE